MNLYVNELNEDYSDLRSCTRILFTAYALFVSLRVHLFSEWRMETD